MVMNWLALAVVLWFTYRLGKSAGIDSTAAKLKANVQRLSAAEEEAMQCRFAYALVMAALQAQEKRLATIMEELALAESEQVNLRFKIVELETRIFDARMARGPTVSESEREMLVRPGPVILPQGGGKS